MDTSYLPKVIQHIRGRSGLRPLYPSLPLKSLPSLDPLRELMTEKWAALGSGVRVKATVSSTPGLGPACSLEGPCVQKHPLSSLKRPWARASPALSLPFLKACCPYKSCHFRSPHNTAPWHNKCSSQMYFILFYGNISIE